LRPPSSPCRRRRGRLLRDRLSPSANKGGVRCVSGRLCALAVRAGLGQSGASALLPHRHVKEVEGGHPTSADRWGGWPWHAALFLCRLTSRPFGPRGPYLHDFCSRESLSGHDLEPPLPWASLGDLHADSLPPVALWAEANVLEPRRNPIAPLLRLSKAPPHGHRRQAVVAT
jgi:hypothetical protein